MANEQISMPSGMGGLVRYFDDYKSKIEVSPKIVVGVIIFMVILVIMLHRINILGL